MVVSEDILKQSCTTECPRFCAGTCPYHYDEKDICPRIRALLNPLKDE